MASGDFHDSDFHSGDFHFSSDFSSGDYSGGSYDSGFDSDGNPCRGRREPTKFDLVVTKIYFLILLPLLAIFYLYYYAAQGKVMGLNTINLTIFVVAGVLFALSLWHSVRTSALVKLRRDGTSDDYVFSAKIPATGPAPLMPWLVRTTRFTVLHLTIWNTARRTAVKSSGSWRVRQVSSG